jgi:hypothetical protein
MTTSNRGSQLGRPALSHLYLLASGRMQNCVRQFQPFGGHLALNGTIFLIGDRRHHFQTMRGVPSIFLVLGLRWNSHDSPLSATGMLANLRRVAGEVCLKVTTPKLKRCSRDGKGPVQRSSQNRPLMFSNPANEVGNSPVPSASKEQT